MKTMQERVLERIKDPSYNPNQIYDSSVLTESEFAEQHRKYLSASMAGAIVLGQNFSTTKEQIWFEQTGQIPQGEPLMSAIDGLSGHLFEAPVAELIFQTYPELKGWRMKKDTFTHQDPRRPWLVTNLDFILIDPEGHEWIFEIKTTNWRSALDTWKQDIVPLPYVLQCHVEAHVYNPYGVVVGAAWGLKKEDTALFFLERDLDQEADVIAHYDEMHECIIKKIRPEFDADPAVVAKSLGYLYGDSDPSVPTLELDGEEHARRLATYARLGNKLARMKELYEQAIAPIKSEYQAQENEFMRLMEQAENAEIAKPDGSGSWSISWKSRIRRGVDTDKLKEDGIYNDYLKVTTSRTFTSKALPTAEEIHAVLGGDLAEEEAMLEGELEGVAES